MPLLRVGSREARMKKKRKGERKEGREWKGREGKRRREGKVKGGREGKGRCFYTVISTMASSSVEVTR